MKVLPHGPIPEGQCINSVLTVFYAVITRIESCRTYCCSLEGLQTANNTCRTYCCSLEGLQTANNTCRTSSIATLGGGGGEFIK